eukprot:366296-Chlamydomonas_euryale.AAC.9
MELPSGSKTWDSRSFQELPYPSWKTHWAPTDQTGKASTLPEAAVAFARAARHAPLKLTVRPAARGQHSEAGRKEGWGEGGGGSGYSDACGAFSSACTAFSSGAPTTSASTSSSSSKSASPLAMSARACAASALQSNRNTTYVSTSD